MKFIKRLLSLRSSSRFADLDDEWPGPGRKLRTFDIEMIAPYDHKPLIAFLRADKLSDLTSPQVRIFLLLTDTVAPEGLTASYIAEYLEMPQRSVRSCLSVLKRLGYAQHSSIEGRDGRGRRIVAWVYDPTHWFSDEEFGVREVVPYLDRCDRPLPA